VGYGIRFRVSSADHKSEMIVNDLAIYLEDREEKVRLLIPCVLHCDLYLFCGGTDETSRTCTPFDSNVARVKFGTQRRDVCGSSCSRIHKVREEYRRICCLPCLMVPFAEEMIQMLWRGCCVAMKRYCALQQALI
jgi:hypothetical protein